ncbi:hypothetical protein QWY31_00085 [Cytophagales bacterium LB-30]|uniref:Fibronectin type III domain-containing protein n=1 Tax=Shiella aurantiaca TaxID=3058365 RepID=A0ABT8F0B6_9BACT|nr:hypothetical protein [Shiella aurantiaca]MDN4163872.1 hypothetical protein [Shiella aurantiaca]
MRKRCIAYFIAGLILLAFTAQAQEKRGTVHTLARAYASDSIRVRWAPSDPLTWELGKKYGYVLERYTVSINGQFNDTPTRDKKVLNATPLKPLLLDEWEQPVRNNPLAAIAAQAYYGESFTIEQSQGAILQVIQKSREQEARHGFSLYAADISWQVALLSGLAYTDKNVKANEKYLYRVYVALPETSKMEIDTGFYYIGNADYRPLPSIQAVEVEFSDRKALISWAGPIYQNEYIGYYVERAEADGRFVRINEQPFTQSLDSAGNSTARIQMYDSLPQNFVRYTYRVVGQSSFGEEGPPSDTLSGFGFTALPVSPEITGYIPSPENGLILNWAYPQEFESVIKGFTIWRADSYEGPYQNINPAGVSSTLRSYYDSTASYSNYYKVEVLGHYEAGKESTVYFAQLVDSIPPSRPQGISAEVDSAGLVRLHWQPNSEADIYGYKVYRANYAQDEYSLMHGEILNDTVFTDTVNVHSLTSQVYYKVLALDKRFNASVLSEAYTLILPDFISPVPPAFKRSKITEQGVELHWIPSSSKDVVVHALYRKESQEEGFTLMAIYEEDKLPGYTEDQEVEAGRAYGYVMIAKDAAGNESPPSALLSVRIPLPKEMPPIRYVQGKADRNQRLIRLQWEYKEKGVEAFMIYKSTQADAPVLYKTLGGAEELLIDKQLDLNQTYYYWIKARFTNGHESALSETIRITY